MLTLFLSLSVVHAGAWTPERGDQYGKVAVRVVAGSNAFDLNGDIVPTASYSDLNVQAYYERGLSDALTLVYSGTPIGRATYGGESAPYLGPNAVGLRRSLWNADLKVAVEGRVGWSEPFGATDLAAEANSELTPAGYTYIPAVANHFLDLELNVGRGIKNGWAAGAIGGRTNTGEGMGDAVTGFAQFGWVFKQKFVADAHTSWYLPTGLVETVNVAGAGDTRYVSFGLGFGWWFRQDLGLVVGFEGAFMAESNAGTPSLSVGLQFK